jgi:carbon starvation protein
MALNAFILTTLDTATRIGRYLTSELFGISNRFLSTGLVVLFAGVLALSGQWQRIWPVFGASNQLVAALSLLVVSAWLVQKKGKVWFTLGPSLFMLVTTVGAFLFQIYSSFSRTDAQGKWDPNITIGITATVCVVLALMVFIEGCRSIRIRVGAK